MNPSPEDDFQQLRRLLALKKHEEPPPGYFHYLPDRVLTRIERSLSTQSTWWDWLVAKLDAQPVLAGAYAFAISGLMLLGFKLSQDLQHETAENGVLGAALDPTTVRPSESLQKIFANPAPLLYFTEFTSTEPVLQEPAAMASFKTFPEHAVFSTTGH
jgi:hypothetical protein